MSPSLAAVAVVAAAIAGQADTPPSHHQHLADVAWWIGTWDVKGKMADGREFKGQHTWQWSLNKNFLTGDMTSSANGKSVVEAQFVIGWEPTKKEIKGWEFWRDGYRGTFVVTNEGKRLEGSGEGPDGPEKWTGVTDLSEDQNSYSYKATIKKDDGTKAAFEFKAVRRDSGQKRVGETAAEGIPPKAVKAMQFFVGKWEGETYVNGQKIGSGSDKREWLPGKYCLLMSGIGTEDGDKQRSTGLCGWDAKGEQLVETWHASDGLYAVIRYPVKSMTKDAWPGDFTVTFGDGKTYDGTCSLNIEDEGFTWIARWEQDGKEMVRKGVARRMKSQ